MTDLKHDPEVYDITIIGGGPVGLYAAFYAGVRQMKVKLIDSLEQLGGQLTAIYPEKEVYDVGGFYKSKAKDIIEGLILQAKRHNPTIRLSERIEGMEKLEDGTFRLVSDRGTHLTRTIVLALGVGAFEPKRLPKMDTRPWEDKGVRFFVRDPMKLAGRNVLIIGGGDSAVDWVFTLERIARHVTLIHRRAGFRALDEAVDRLHKSDADVKVYYELKEIRGDHKIREAVIFDNRTGEEEVLKVNTIIMALGFKADIKFLKDWGLEMDGRDLKVDALRRTNVEGIWAAGDCTTYEGSLKLIATGIADAAIAVNAAKVYVDPTEKMFPGHSSDLMADKKGQ